LFTKKEFHFSWLTILKSLSNKHKFLGRKTPTTKGKVANSFAVISHIFCKHNFKLELQTSCLYTALNLSLPVEMGKTERVEGQGSLHTAEGLTG